MLTITKTDLVNLGWNNVYTFVPACIGFVSASLVNIVAHKILKIPSGGLVSNRIRLASFVVGTAASLCFLPKIPLIEFTARKAFECCIIGVSALLAVFLVTKKTRHLPFIGGTMIGLIGKPALVLTGGAGALIGSYIN